MGEELDVGLVVIESSETESEVQDESSKSGNDTYANDAHIRPIYDKEPMAKVGMEAHCIALELKYQNQSVKSGQHGQFSKVKSDEAKIKHDIDEIESINIELEHSVAKLLTENADLKAQLQEKVFTIIALKNELRKLKGNNVDTKFTKPSVLGKPILQPLRHQSVVRQPNAFKSKRPKILKPRFASQVDVKNDLSKPVTHHLPKGRESDFSKHNHVIASSESRNSSKNMPRFSSNDMVHNHYLEEAKKKTQK
ncbi:hypothetical protein Tco_1006665 [Tanacetum coccineum]|uniref:Uncharacterized protein n=1 Tax=Tanacetum coccineum TaxID=301880 RepID=A0ABQ5FKA7_9ASTR